MKGCEEMIFDYTQKPEQEEVGGLFETLSSEQEAEVVEFIKGLQETQNRQRQQFYSNWIMDSIIPLLKDVAKKTHSYLDVHLDKDSIFVLLKNNRTIDIAAPDELRNMKLALLLADYIEMNSDGEFVRLHMIYNVANKDD